MARFPSLASVKKTFAPAIRFFRPVYKQFRKLPSWLQVVLVVVIVLALLIGIGDVAKLLGPADTTDSSIPTVTLAPVAELAGNGTSVGVLGTVRSEAEADLLAQSGGTVTGVHTTLGGMVPAGFVLAEVDNASQRAAVLQAEGAYDAAVAARSGVSPTDIAASALNTYTSAYNSLDSILKTDVDTFYGNPGAQGPQFLISPSPFDFSYFSEKRAALTLVMNQWNSHLASATSANAPALLDEADAATRQATALITDIATAATKNGTDANATQLAALATARASIASLQASITAAKSANQGQSTAATAGADASVKTALGALRGAQANLEKTLVRAPIAGQVNFLPIRIGDYVTPLEHVATVAQNGALEIVTYVSEDDRALLSVGTKVTVEDTSTGVVTSISPALDPLTKQIEVHIAVNATSTLENGQSVHIGLPNTAPIATASSTGPLLLPLTALKLTPSARVVFSVGEDGKLVAHAVEIGDVQGDRIEILTALPGDLRIVTDARGLSEGEKVNIAAVP